MREYNGELKKVICNNCGKELLMEKNIVIEGEMNFDCKWGYFSKKDGKIDSFDLCEKCYDEILSKFVIPVTRKDYQELL